MINMYGLLGKKLSHSFSKIIHEDITRQPYELNEVDNLDQFFNNEQFKGLNVTIPYKSDVIKYLDKLSTEARETNAVNTIYFLGGKLIGANTDYFGLDKALSYNNISVRDMNVLILGNGSTSRTIQYYCRQNLAKNITILARNPKENEYHFSNVDNHKNTNIIFNATPVGMFPNNNDDKLVSLDTFSNLNSVVDVVYNPLRSNLLIEAENLGIKAVNGLFMLIAQAVKSIELFHNIEIKNKTIVDLYKNLTQKMKNLVFIGMPMSGKSFFTRLCSEKYNKELIDVDSEIEDYINDSIENIFKHQGEKYFRKVESQIIENVSKLNNKAISCGGGVILSEYNMNNLKQNGIILFIDVPLELLRKCNPKGRPLLQDRKNIDKLYNERYDLYKRYADIVISKTSFNEKKTMSEIEVKINEYINT